MHIHHIHHLPILMGLLICVMTAIGAIGLGGFGIPTQEIIKILLKLGDGPFEAGLKSKMMSVKEAVRADMKKNGWLKTEQRHDGDKTIDVDVLDTSKDSKSRKGPAAVIAEIQFSMWNIIIDTGVGSVGKKLDGLLAFADKFRDNHHAYVYDQTKHLLSGSQPALSFDDAYDLVVKAEVEITS